MLDDFFKPGKVIPASQIPNPKIGDLTVQRKLSQGDLCDLYLCTFEIAEDEEARKEAEGERRSVWERLTEDEVSGTVDNTCLLKVARYTTDNDLVNNEADVLGVLYPPEEEDEKFLRYLPKMLAHFRYADHQVNLIPYFRDYVTWEQILEAFPSGIDFRDLIWMFKRALIGLGFAHERGIIHGSPIPSHVLVHPVDHGARLIDWSYSVKREGKQSIRAYSANYRSYVPPEVFTKQFPTPATDIFMLAKGAVDMLGGDPNTHEMDKKVPKPVQELLLRCLEDKPADRPQNAWDLHDEFSAVIKSIVGKPKYRLFQMPV